MPGIEDLLLPAKAALMAGQSLPFLNDLDPGGRGTQEHALARMFRRYTVTVPVIPDGAGGSDPAGLFHIAGKGFAHRTQLCLFFGKNLPNGP